MKIQFLVLLIICLSVPLMAEQNLIPNGNFENPLEKSGWKYKMFRNANASIERTKIQPGEGKFSVRITIREIRSGFVELWSPEFSLPACRKLTLSCKYKSSARFQSSLVLVVQYNDNGRKKYIPLTENRLRFEKKNIWTRAKKTFELPQNLQNKKTRAFIKISQFGSTAEIETLLDEISLITEE